MFSDSTYLQESALDETSRLAKLAIEYLQLIIADMGFTVHVHFELEGCYRFAKESANSSLDLMCINEALARLNIDGELVNEYWQNQWEYVSLFNGQSPLKEAENLAKAMRILPQLFAQQGVCETLIKPVVWSGDNAQLALGSKNIFTGGERSIHIPNAIQLNISVSDGDGKNLIAEHIFGEYLQQCLLETSLPCSLLYLPESEAFERFKLKSLYGLQDELCSPMDISGGHQGSVALYRQYGKHNQLMGQQTLVVDSYNEALVSSQNWQNTARIEHRLGAASAKYNPYINIVYVLLNVFDALQVHIKGACQQKLMLGKHNKKLPTSLWPNNEDQGAVALFADCSWFVERLNQAQKYVESEFVMVRQQTPSPLGEILKKCILAKYAQQKILTE